MSKQNTLDIDYAEAVMAAGIALTEANRANKAVEAAQAVADKATDKATKAIWAAEVAQLIAEGKAKA